MKTFTSAIVSLSVASVLLFTPAARASVYSTAVLADNPTVYYQMSDSTTVVNDSAPTGGSNTGTYRDYGVAQAGAPGPILNQPGPRPIDFPGMDAANVATLFDGDNTGPTTQDNIALPAANVVIGSDYSVEFWFNGTRPFTDTGVQYLLTRGSAGTGADQIGIGGNFVGSGIVANKLYFFNGTGNVDPFGPTLSNGTWYQMTFVRSGNDISLYLNGAFQTTLNRAPGFSTDAFYFATQLSSTGNSLINGFNGRLDEISIYDFALTSNQIAAHYEAAFATPEPSTMMLLGCGGLLCWRRVKNRLP